MFSALEKECVPCPSYITKWVWAMRWEQGALYNLGRKTFLFKNLFSKFDLQMVYSLCVCVGGGRFKNLFCYNVEGDIHLVLCFFFVYLFISLFNLVVSICICTCACLQACACVGTWMWRLEDKFRHQSLGAICFIFFRLGLSLSWGLPSRMSCLVIMPQGSVWLCLSIIG